MLFKRDVFKILIIGLDQSGKTVHYYIQTDPSKHHQIECGDES